MDCYWFFKPKKKNSCLFLKIIFRIKIVQANVELIREKIKNLKGVPGCYLWKNHHQEVIYVGKALRLSERVRSYLNPNQNDLKTKSLQAEIYDLDWIATNTEEEALILEDTLIKKYNPRYNVRLKDDKHYPYICISTDEAYPMLYFTRKIGDEKKRYFGPFSDTRATRQTIDLIQKIFPIRKTVQKLPLKTPRRPCLNYHIKRCLAPCQGNISQEEYNRIINQVIDFLEGKKDSVEKSLIEQMNEYSARMEFEKAAVFRDVLTNVRSLRKKQTILQQGGGDSDIISFAVKEDEGQVVVLEVRCGHLDNKKTFGLKGVAHSNGREIIGSFLEQYYLMSKIIPPEIVLPPGAKIDSEFLLDFLQKKHGKKPKILYPQGGDKKSLLNIAGKNATMNLTERILATRFRDKTAALKELQQNLQLSDRPEVIECYDISHFQGAEPVASGVQFINGKPNKSGYRHYKIRSYQGINDPGMIHEVIGRRLQRLSNEGEKIPDLIIIDGGYTQLQRACEAAVALGLESIAMIGLAKKREEVFFPGENHPYSFDKHSASMRMIRNIRDEAHRFGVTYHRKRRNRATIKNLLDEIPDIGKHRKKAIQKYFADKKHIETAEPEDFLQVPGIGKKLAEKIYQTIRQSVK